MLSQIRPHSTRHRWALPLTVGLVSVALTFALAWTARTETQRAANDRLDARARDVARQVEDRFDAYTGVLIGLRALLAATPELSARQFEDYVQTLGLSTHFPGFQVLNFAPRVRSLGTPQSDRHPLTFIAPRQGNEDVLGRDLSAQPTAALALEKARDSGELTSSGRLIPRHGAAGEVGMAIRLPVYRGQLPLRNVDERRAAYLGSVGAGFHTNQMLRDIVPADPASDQRLRVYDGGPVHTAAVPGEAPDAASKASLAGQTLLFDSRPRASQGPEVALRRLSFEVGGRRWLVDYSSSSNGGLTALDRATSDILLACGLAISALLAAILYALTHAREQAMALATDMTRHLRASEQRLAQAQHLAHLGSWELIPDTGAFQCSAEAQRLLGFDQPAVTLATLLACVPADERAAVRNDYVATFRDGQRSEFEHRLLRPDGQERWLHVIAQVSKDGGQAVVHGTVRDETDRHRHAMCLQVEHEVAQLLLGDGDPENVLASALAALCDSIGWDAAVLWRGGAQALPRRGPVWSRSGDRALATFVAAASPPKGLFLHGSASPAGLYLDPITGGNGDPRMARAHDAGLRSIALLPVSGGREPVGLECFSRQPVHGHDVLDTLRAVALQLAQYEQRRQAEQALRHLAFHDGLTGLPNRASLQPQLEQAIHRNHRHGMRLAVMFLDLDHFKRINDSLGHGVGDALIQACAQRLKSLLRTSDTMVRFGGDEFVLLLEDLGAASDAAVVAESVLSTWREPFMLDGRELHVGASIGVSICPEDGEDAETLLKNADTAMYRAKDRGRGCCQFYAPQMNAQGTERLLLENGLRRAVERGELALHYQPKMKISSSRLTGVEALLRWHHPVLGMVSPAQFIPLAEETGLIETIGLWVLEQACADARAWHDSGLEALQISVNLSARQLGPQLIEQVSDILARTGLAPELLELEVTESAVMKNPEHAASLLQGIRALGVHLAIDDFGTGYSSLAYLRRFPFSTVKIDRSFVKDLSGDRDAQALAQGIVTLAHGLRMKVVAEGVETDEQLAFLRGNGCDEMQGFLLCKPLPADDALAFIKRHRRHPIATAETA